VSGRTSAKNHAGAESLTARVVLVLAFLAVCLAGIAVSPLLERWKVLAFTGAGLVLVTILAAIVIFGWKNDDTTRVATVVLLTAVTAAAIITIASFKFSNGVKNYVYWGEGVGLFIIWVVAIFAVWVSTS